MTASMGALGSAEGQAETDKRPGASETRLAAIEKELATIRGLLQTLLLQTARTAPPPPAGTRSAPPGATNIEGEIHIANDHFQGSADAKLIIVEFSDYQCPYCGRHARETLTQLRQSHIAAGKLGYVFKNLPIPELHPLAFKAAEAAECAGEQGRFWEMHDGIFGDQGALTRSALTAGAKKINLDLKRFQKCLDGGMTERVWRDIADSKRFDLSGTPAFLIGRLDQGRRVELRRKISGAQPYAVFVAVLEELADVTGPTK